MNYLAHLYLAAVPAVSSRRQANLATVPADVSKRQASLADGIDESLVGSLLGDSVKGDGYNQYSTGFRRGSSYVARDPASRCYAG